MADEKKQINYDNYVLDPSKDVLVPAPVYVALYNMLGEVEKQHSKLIRTDKISYYNKVTHKKLSDKNKSKLSPEKLEADYYPNINFESTDKNRSVQRDTLGFEAVRLLAEFRGVFRHNVDQGNKMLRPELQQNVDPISVGSVEHKSIPEEPIENEG